MEIDVFVGNRNNVLQRYRECLSHICVPFAVIVDADDVLVCVNTIVKMLEFEGSTDYAMAVGLPYGGAPSGLSREIIDRMLDDNASPNGWGASVHSYSQATKTVVCEELPPGVENLRISLDYPEDLDFLRYLFAQLGNPEDVSLRGAVEYIMQNKIELEKYFPALFDGTIASRATEHLQAEINAWEN